MPIKQIDYYGQFTPTGVDTSTAKRYQALAGLADQANELAFNIAAKKRKEQGAKAGLEAGIQAAETGEPIESKQGILSSFSIFDQAYNSAMESAYVASIDQDVRENISTLAAENPTDFQAFNARANQYVNGVLSGVSEEYQTLVGASIDSVLSSARMQIREAEIAKNIKQSDEILTNVANLATQDAMKYAQIGDEESSLTERAKAFAAIDSRVGIGQLTATAAETIKKNIIVSVSAEQARGGLQTIIREKGAINAVSFIQSMQDAGPLEGFTVEQKNALVDTLRSDLSQYIQLQNVKDSEEEENVKAQQKVTASNLFIGIMNDTTDAGALQMASMNNQIDFTQLSQLTSVLNSRGKGIDDYGLIRTIQQSMSADPESAIELIQLNANTRLTGATATQLYTQALSATESESPLQTSQAKRFRNFLQNSVRVVGDFGALDMNAERRLAQLNVVYDQRILDGEDPAVIASELIDVNAILSTSETSLQTVVDSAKEALRNAPQDKAAQQKVADARRELDEYRQKKANADAFQRSLDQALKGK
jgi:hypothetical protein